MIWEELVQKLEYRGIDIIGDNGHSKALTDKYEFYRYDEVTRGYVSNKIHHIFKITEIDTGTPIFDKETTNYDLIPEMIELGIDAYKAHTISDEVRVAQADILLWIQDLLMDFRNFKYDENHGSLSFDGYIIYIYGSDTIKTNFIGKTDLTHRFDILNKDYKALEADVMAFVRQVKYSIWRNNAIKKD